MYAELSVSEAERMLLKIEKLGKHHQNAKFLATEALSDLRNAERNLYALDHDDKVRVKEKIEVIKQRINSLGIV